MKKVQNMERMRAPGWGDRALVGTLQGMTLLLGLAVSLASPTWAQGEHAPPSTPSQTGARSQQATPAPSPLPHSALPGLPAHHHETGPATPASPHTIQAQGAGSRVEAPKSAPGAHASPNSSSTPSSPQAREAASKQAPNAAPPQAPGSASHKAAPSSKPKGATDRDIAYERKLVDGLWMQIIYVNLHSSLVDVQPMVAGHAPLFAKNKTRTFRSMIAASKCTAAINGTFFDLRTSNTLGTVVYQGKVVSQGFVGDALAVDYEGNPRFVKLHHVNNHKIDWKRYRFAVGAGPSLIDKGHISVNPHDEGFRDRHLCGSARRSALGFSSKGKMMLVTVSKSVTLSKLAHAMKSLGCYYALNLDGGTSSGLYYNGRYLTAPGRTLTNILTVRLHQPTASDVAATVKKVPATLEPEGDAHKPHGSEGTPRTLRGSEPEVVQSTIPEPSAASSSLHPPGNVSTASMEKPPEHERATPPSSHHAVPPPKVTPPLDSLKPAPSPGPPIP